MATLKIRNETNTGWYEFGAAGAQGPQGSQGFQGQVGAQGPQGTVGNQGAEGNAGAQGSVGAQGSQGAQGFQGSVGSTGAQGVQGITGAQGGVGAQGSVGAQGTQGVDGVTGPQGTQGILGGTGVSGAQGSAGAQGFQGVTGAGIQGSQGAQGTRGFQGFQGDVAIVSGPTPPIDTNSLWLDETDLNTSIYKGDLGPQGYQGAQGVTGAQGVVGSQGYQGVNGIAGAQGSQGVTGVTGSQGAAGVVGATGVVFRGAWSGSTAYVSGDSTASGGTSYICILANTGQAVTNATYWSVLALQGTQGSQGSSGATGLQGPQGAAGSQGATGLQGSQGSMGNNGAQGVVGAQGGTGAQGNQGTKGYQGTDGAQGSTGTTGYQGAQGSNGTAGAQGSTGAQGFTGATGWQGATGSQGSQGAAGNVGSQGSVGSQGNTGATGWQGATGSQGSQGAAGNVGSQGSVGSQGNTGATGWQGATGSQGSQGLMGSQGNTGYTGNTGPTGATGNTGATGAQGAQGLLGSTLASAVTVLGGGFFNSGKSYYTDPTSGFYLGNDGSPKFAIGDNTRSMKFDTGSGLQLNGATVNDVGGTSVSNNFTENGVSYIHRPIGAAYGGNISGTGAMLITLPMFPGVNAQVRFRVQIYDINQQRMIVYRIAMTLGGSSGTVAGVDIGVDTGDASRALQVSVDSVGAAYAKTFRVAIGTASTYWAYFSCRIVDFAVSADDGGGDILARWGSGWTVGIQAAGLPAALVVSAATVGTISAMGIYSSGNVTAYSDERVKTNWRDLELDFVDRLAEVKSGIYDRTDRELTQAGVSAQSLRDVLFEAVETDRDGKLSVAYGNAALVASIEIARRLIELERKFEALAISHE